MSLDILRQIRRPLAAFLIACVAFTTFGPAVLQARELSLLDVQSDQRGETNGQIRAGQGSRYNVYVSRLPVSFNGATWILITDAPKAGEGPHLLSAVWHIIKPYLDGKPVTRYCAGEDDWSRQVQRVELLKALKRSDDEAARRDAIQKVLHGIAASAGIAAGATVGVGKLIGSLAGLLYEATIGAFYKGVGWVMSRLTGQDVELDGYKAMGLKGEDVITVQNVLKVWNGTCKTLNALWTDPAQLAEDTWSGMVLNVLNAGSAFDQGFAAGEQAFGAAIIIVGLVSLPALASKAARRVAAIGATYSSIGEALAAALAEARVMVVRFGRLANTEIPVVPYLRGVADKAGKLLSAGGTAEGEIEAGAALRKAITEKGQAIVTTAEAPADEVAVGTAAADAAAAARPEITTGQVRHLLERSEGRPGLGGGHRGHAGDHVPFLTSDNLSGRDLAAARTKTHTTTWLHEREALQDLRNALLSKKAEIDALPRGTELPAFEYSLPKPRAGYNGHNPSHVPGASVVTECTFERVRLVLQKLENGKLHVVQYTPLLDP